MYERGYGQGYLKLMANIFKPRFLPASLHIEAILRSTTIAGRRETLELIKDRSGDPYGAALERIKAQDEEKTNLALAALTWVCYSERPLQVDELCHALAVQIGATDIDLENVPSIGTLLYCCQGLMAVDSEASTVRLIHYTAQEYLCSHPGLFSRPQSILAETCLTYLNSHLVKRLTPHSFPPPQITPFLNYSARYWGTHANKDLSDRAMALALGLLTQYEEHISAISLLVQVLPPSFIGAISTSPLFSGLHCASFFGIVELVIVLISDESCEVDQQDCAGRTPLAWAAWNGHEGVVKTLLESKNVDPNSLDVHGGTPLANAAVYGHEGVVKLLLKRDNVNPNLPDSNGNRPLGYAAINGHEEVVKLLLERENVDPNLANMNGDGPLGCAAIFGHEGVAKLLLERENVDPNLQNTDGDGPLSWAVMQGHDRVVTLLLEREDVDPNRRNKNGQTPLACAVHDGNEGLVKLLLEREDVDPYLRDNFLLTPLSYATWQGRERIVQLLQARISAETPGAGHRRERKRDVLMRLALSALE